MKKQMEVILSSDKEYQGLLQAVFLSTQDAISVVNEKGDHLMVNPAYTNITGIAADDIIGKNALYDILDGESVHCQVLKTGRPVDNTKLRIKPSGKTVVASAAPIMVDGMLRGSVAVLHDMTGIKDLTEKLMEAEKKIRELTTKYNFDDIIGESKKLRSCKQQAAKAAAVPATVLLRGESGTGKEMFAHAIHAQSGRHLNQFVRVNCAALSETLLESELFGYEDGAFTGAKKGGKKGLFEEADNGTLFLDEISEISINMQAKLLRVLQEKEIMRVGGTKSIPVNVRIIAATNRDLKKAVAEGMFREDLFYRLNMLPIFIPPLRERKDDIPLLIKKFIVKINDEYGRNISSMSDDAVRVMMRYDWPGNVRELENVVGRCIISMNFNEHIIMCEHLPNLDVSQIPKYEAAVVSFKDDDGDLNSIMDRAEAEYIKYVYDKMNSNKTRTAAKLGISLRALYYKLQKHDIS